MGQSNRAISKRRWIDLYIHRGMMTRAIGPVTKRTLSRVRVINTEPALFLLPHEPFT